MRRVLREGDEVAGFHRVLRSRGPAGSKPAGGPPLLHDSETRRSRFLYGAYHVSRFKNVLVPYRISLCPEVSVMPDHAVAEESMPPPRSPGRPRSPAAARAILDAPLELLAS